MRAVLFADWVGAGLVLSGKADAVEAVVDNSNVKDSNWVPAG